MPRTRKKGKGKGKRYMTRRYRSNRIGYQPHLGVAERQLVKLRYVDCISLNPGVATTAVHLFNCNGIFKPDQTSPGHQPRMSDQWYTFYSHAVVLGSKITIKALNAGTTTIANQIVGCRLSPNTTSYAQVNEYLEDEHTVYKPLGLTGAGKVTVTQKFSPKNFLGRSDPLSDPDLKNTIAANCPENAFYDVFVAGMNAADDPPGADLLIEIDYICMFIEPLHVGQS